MVSENLVLKLMPATGPGDVPCSAVGGWGGCVDGGGDISAGRRRMNRLGRKGVPGRGNSEGGVGVGGFEGMVATQGAPFLRCCR